MAQDRPGEEKPEGFSKYLKRMKTVLRPRSVSKRQSHAAPETATAAPTEPAPAPTPAPVQSTTPARGVIEPEPVVMTENITTTQHAKASALFAKYGLTLDPGAWKTPPDLQQLNRVTKPIRMRVRRTCHRCETTFGAEKVCINCSHTRCTKCPRFPPAHDEGEPHIHRPKIQELSANHPRGIPATPHIKYSGDATNPLLKLSRTGGQDLVRKQVRQRVHRSCHVCTAQFTSASKHCEVCRHVRCKKCPRDPAKLDKYPDGYPGDADPPKALPDRAFKRPRQRIHYLCHVCTTTYLQDSETCAGCGQVKCAETIRIPPKKVKREPDPELVRSVEEKLAAMAITPKQTAAEG
ncbi:unnamed protein product [Penicillium salamii]|uniref:Uncharacterized protein n=1 Tax=Penicillium salamii TaxID=1612424 RepID=A0A9W4IB19_9EURO|nr:unnamed protein product [Penicillium salamii]CAG8035890.1 unnamed protein product [Penicillium salamii]CAG8088856.1 unnamed protein product [Penicillium salamii]CAG8165668.1 unnamed protein product [Penicillium salamii]CAG8205215.1 unnamed protein product [Penicillium salamii]